MEGMAGQSYDGEKPPQTLGEALAELLQEGPGDPDSDSDEHRIWALTDVLAEQDLESRYRTLVALVGDPCPEARKAAYVAVRGLAGELIRGGQHLRAMELMVAYSLPRRQVDAAYQQCIAAHPDLDDSIRPRLDQLYGDYCRGGCNSLIACGLQELDLQPA